MRKFCNTRHRIYNILEFFLNFCISLKNNKTRIIQIFSVTNPLAKNRGLKFGVKIEIFFWRASNNPIIINSIQEYFGLLYSMYFYKEDELTT